MLGDCRLLALVALSTAGGCATPDVSIEPAPEPGPAVEPPAVVEAEPATDAAAACPEQPGLCLRVTPPGARLTVDGVDVGLLSELAAGTAHFHPVASGIHQITLEHDGYVTWRAEVSVRDTLENIDVELTPEPGS